MHQMQNWEHDSRRNPAAHSFARQCVLYSGCNAKPLICTSQAPFANGDMRTLPILKLKYPKRRGFCLFFLIYFSCILVESLLLTAQFALSFVFFLPATTLQKQVAFSIITHSCQRSLNRFLAQGIRFNRRFHAGSFRPQEA